MATPKGGATSFGKQNYRWVPKWSTHHHKLEQSSSPKWYENKPVLHIWTYIVKGWVRILRNPSQLVTTKWILDRPADYRPPIAYWSKLLIRRVWPSFAGHISLPNVEPSHHVPTKKRWFPGLLRSWFAGGETGFDLEGTWGAQCLWCRHTEGNPTKPFGKFGRKKMERSVVKLCFGGLFFWCLKKMNRCVVFFLVVSFLLI